MAVAYVFHHLGLGDYVICNGLMRTIAEPNTQYVIFIQEHNIPSVRFMYRDVPNFTFQTVTDWNHMHSLAYQLQEQGHAVLWLSYTPHQGYEFDEYFYLMQNVDFIKRWSAFHCDRDRDRERYVFNEYQVTEGQYIFLHDDPSRGFNIDLNHIVNKDLDIVRPIPGLTDNAFDYCYLMEHSAESHFIDSCFRLIFDSFQLRLDNLFYHINLSGGIIKDPVTKSASLLPFKLI